MKIAAYFFLSILTITSFAQSDEMEIRAVMSSQEQCWNDGDLECFMQGYWKSDDLVFIGKNGLTYGWENILKNYQNSYPDKDAMGRLAFEIKLLEPISEDHWFMIGKWELETNSGNPNGHFSLVWRRLGDEWVIVADHSS